MSIGAGIITTTILAGGAAYIGTERAMSNIITRIDNIEAWQRDVKMWQKDKEDRWMNYAETKGDITARLKTIENNQANIERKIDDIYRIAKKN